MKKNVFVLFALVVFTQQNFAQKPEFRQNKMEKIKQMRIGFISNKLNLDSKTAERFWPVYNKFVEEQKALRVEKKEIFLNKNKISNNNEEAAMAINKMQDFEQRHLDLQKRYKVEFLKVISPSQLANLYESEKEFREMVMKRMGRNRNRGEGIERMDKNRRMDSDENDRSNEPYPR